MQVRRVLYCSETNIIIIIIIVTIDMQMSTYFITTDQPSVIILYFIGFRMRYYRYYHYR